MADDIEVTETKRGFRLVNFKDHRGNECSLQKSSTALSDCVWLGCDNIALKRFEAFIGWSDVVLTDIHPNGPYYTANTRMHLTQSQVAALLPFLQRFVETGELS